MCFCIGVGISVSVIWYVIKLCKEQNDKNAQNEQNAAGNIILLFLSYNCTQRAK